MIQYNDNSRHAKRIKISGINYYLGVKNAGDNFDSYIELLSIFYMNGLIKIDTIRNYLFEENYKDFMIEVHGLKGAANTIGATDLTEYALKLERLSRDIISGNVYSITLLNDNIDMFLNMYSNILKAIEPYIKEKEIREDTLISIDDSEIINEINQTIELIQSFELDDAEKILDKLQLCKLNDNTRSMLNNAYNDLTRAFNYTGAVEYLQNTLRLYKL